MGHGIHLKDNSSLLQFESHLLPGVAKIWDCGKLAITKSDRARIGRGQMISQKPKV